MRMSGTRRAACTAASAVVSCLLVAGMLAGCGGSSAPKVDDLQQALHDRFGLTNTQAHCVANGLFDHLSTSDLRKLRSADNTGALPKAVQGRYTKALDAVQRACSATTTSTSTTTSVPAGSSTSARSP